MHPNIRLPTPLRAGIFVDRPNRFVIRVQLQGRQVPVHAHLPDPGRLRELLVPGARVWLRPAEDPRRRTRWTAVLTETPGGRGVVSVDTTLPNRLVAEALRSRSIDELAEWGVVKTEFSAGRSRFDFLLGQANGRRLVLEVKSVTLVEAGVARFPDAVTARGTRHVGELATLAGREGWAAGVLFVLQREDADRIVAARSIDPEFADALVDAHAAGVRMLGRRCEVTLERVALGASIPVVPA